MQIASKGGTSADGSAPGGREPDVIGGPDGPAALRRRAVPVLTTLGVLGLAAAVAYGVQHAREIGQTRTPSPAQQGFALLGTVEGVDFYAKSELGPDGAQLAVRSAGRAGDLCNGTASYGGPLVDGGVVFVCDAQDGDLRVVAYAAPSGSREGMQGLRTSTFAVPEPAAGQAGASGPAGWEVTVGVGPAGAGVGPVGVTPGGAEGG